MTSRGSVVALGIAAFVFLIAGSSSYYKDINDVTGVTDEDLKKSMEQAAGVLP